MNGWRRTARAAMVLAVGGAASSGAADRGFGQGQAESLSAGFRKAAARAGPAVVTVRPVGVVPPMVQVPIPNVGPFRPGDWIPRTSVRIGDTDAEPVGSGLVIEADRGIVLTTD